MREAARSRYRAQSHVYTIKAHTFTPVDPKFGLSPPHCPISHLPHSESGGLRRMFSPRELKGPEDIGDVVRPPAETTEVLFYVRH